MRPTGAGELRHVHCNTEGPNPSSRVSLGCGRQLCFAPQHGSFHFEGRSKGWELAIPDLVAVTVSFSASCSLTVLPNPFGLLPYLCSRRRLSSCRVEAGALALHSLAFLLHKVPLRIGRLPRSRRRCRARSTPTGRIPNRERMRRQPPHPNNPRCYIEGQSLHCGRDLRSRTRLFHRSLGQPYNRRSCGFYHSFGPMAPHHRQGSIAIMNKRIH